MEAQAGVQCIVLLCLRAGFLTRVEHGGDGVCVVLHDSAGFSAAERDVEFVGSGDGYCSGN